MFEEIKEKLLQRLNPFLEEQGLEVFEFNVKNIGNATLIEVLADRTQGGITIDQCSWINKHLTGQIEQDSLLFGDYTIQVSSPGLDRALKTSKDFQYVVGREVHFFLVGPLLGKWEYQGIVEDVKEDSVKVKLKEKELEIPIHIIQKGVQIIDIRKE
jgi:ribosome maturation factor RimP